MRVSLSGAVRIGSEVTEEELQLALEPVLRSLILKEDFSAPTFEDAAYTAILTALTTGTLNVGGNVGSNSSLTNQTATSTNTNTRPTTTTETDYAPYVEQLKQRKVSRQRAQLQDALNKFLKSEKSTGKHNIGKSAGTNDRPKNGEIFDGTGTVVPQKIIDFNDETKVMNELNAAQTAFSNLAHEECVTVTRDGRVWHVKGEKKRVNVWSVRDAGGELDGSYSYHNHPTAETYYSFSADDVQFFFAAKEAYSKAADDQFEYVMIRTPETLDVEPDAAYSRFKEIFKKEILKLSYAGEIDIDRDGYHEVMKRLSDEYGFSYERRPLNGNQ